MLDNPVIQNIFSVALYLLRIAVPLLSIVVVCRCFHSLKAGRRREDPVVILQDMVTKEIIPVLYWENSLGRSRSCDIVLHDSTVSRDHAVLMRRESGWIVVDTNSKAGTRVNGKKVEDRAQILPGDVITLGSTSLMLKRTSEAKNLKPPKRRRVHAASVWLAVCGDADPDHALYRSVLCRRAIQLYAADSIGRFGCDGVGILSLFHEGPQPGQL